MVSLAPHSVAPSALSATAAPASTLSFSDLIVPSIHKLIDPDVSAVSVAKELIHAAGTSAGGVAADAAVPDGIEMVARWVGADGLLAKYGPGRAASAITEPLVEKLVTGPIMKGCMAVIENHSALLSLAISGITALQVGVIAAAGIATAYALYKYFTNRADVTDKQKTPSHDTSTELCTAIASVTGQMSGSLR